MVESGDRWEKESEIAEVYMNNMGAIYGDEELWGETAKGIFEAALQNTDAVVQPRQSNTWGALSLDHVYEFMGGLTLSVRHVTGKDPVTDHHLRIALCEEVVVAQGAIGDDHAGRPTED